VAKLEAEIEGMRGNAGQQVERLERELEEARRLAAEASSKVMSLEGELEKERGRRGELEGEVVVEREGREAVERLLEAERRKGADDMSKALAELEDRLRERDAEIAALKIDLDRVSKEGEGLRCEVELLGKRVAEGEGRIEGLERELLEARDGGGAAVARLEGELEVMRGKAAEAERECNESKVVIEVLERERDGLLAKLRDAEGGSEGLKGELGRLEGLVKELESSVVDLKTRNRRGTKS